MIVVYIKDHCDFSKEVLNALHKLGIKADVRNVSHTKYALELIECGGKFQVPCLFDLEKNVCIYESEDIVDYLEEHVKGRSHGKTAKG